MSKKKPIYIVGIVLFSLLLIAALVLYFLILAGFGRGDTGGAMTIFSTIRRAFLPVLIVCILGDGLCIFMLIRISRKRKAAAAQAQAASNLPAELPPATGEDD